VIVTLHIKKTNSSADEIANVNFFTTTSYTHYMKYKKEEKKQTVKQSLNNPQ